MRYYKIPVILQNQTQADAIERGLRDSDIQAFVLIVGLLIDRPDDEKQRIMEFIKGHFAAAEKEIKWVMF